MRRPGPPPPRRQPERRPTPIGERVKAITDLIDEAVGPVPESKDDQ